MCSLMAPGTQRPIDLDRVELLDDQVDWNGPKAKSSCQDDMRLETCGSPRCSIRRDNPASEMPRFCSVTVSRSIAGIS